MPAKKTCPKMEQCAAPLCPLRRSPNSVFYSDEPICTRREFRHLTWIINQKRIRKLALGETYFTVAMLGALRVIPKDIEGINPDLSQGQARLAENRWIKARGILSKINPKATESLLKASV